MSKTQHSDVESPRNPAIQRVMRDPVSRRKFVALAGGTGGAAALLAACGSDDGDSSSSSSGTSSTSSSSNEEALAQFGEGDVGIVNYALTLENLEAAFYKEVIAASLFKGADLALIQMIYKNETEHVMALTAAVNDLGGTPAPPPQTKFDLTSAPEVLKTAATVENLGAAAYLGQAPHIKSPEILAAALSIHTVEGRHAAALNTLVDMPITPDGAFAMPVEAAQVLEQIKPFVA